MADMERSGLMTHELGGEFAAISRVWKRPVQWASWTVLAPLAIMAILLGVLPTVFFFVFTNNTVAAMFQLFKVQ